jgi:TolA-binding protein
MKAIDYSYFIERYNAGEMSETEKQWFLKELEGNDQLQREVELRRKTDELLKKQNVNSLRNKLIEIENNRKAIKTVRRELYPALLKYAAVALILIMAGGSYFYTQTGSLNNDEIVSRYYKVYEAPTSNRSVNNVKVSDYKLALDFYNTRDYKRAAEFFSKVIEENPKDMQSTFLNGMSNFESSKYPEAKKSFGIVISNDNNLFIDQAEWYLAFCYLRTDENAKARQQFEKIKLGNSIYKNDARKILKRLK